MAVTVIGNKLKVEVLADESTKTQLNEIQQEVRDLDSRVDTILTTPVESVSAQEIIDARQGEVSLGANITKVKSQLAQNERQIGNDVRFKEYSEEPIITFITDDGNKADYTHIMPIFDQLEVPFTAAVITNWVNNSSNYLSMEEMQELHNKGHEICSHSHTHVDLTTISDEEIDYELKTSQDLLRKWGFNTSAFAIPHGKFNDNVLKKIAKYYDGARKSGVELVNYNSNPVATFRLHSHFISQQETFEIYKERIDDAVANNGWLIISTHGREVRDWGIEELLHDIVAYAKSKAEVVTLGEGIKRRKNVLSSGVDFKDNRINSEEHFYVSASGKASSNRLPSVILPHNSVDGNTPIEDFENGKESICLITNVGAVNLPEGRGGYLCTYKYVYQLATEQDFFYQTYKVLNSNSIYIRSLKSGNWDNWVKILNQDDNFAFWDNQVTLETLPDVFKTGITLCFVSNGPRGRTGMLTTYSPPGSDKNALSYQTFVPLIQSAISAEMYMRSATSGSWGAWTRVGNTSMNTNRRKQLSKNGLSVGDMVYDYNLNRPVWVKSVDPIEWVYSDGTTVEDE